LTVVLIKASAALHFGLAGFISPYGRHGFGICHEFEGFEDRLQPVAGDQEGDCPAMPGNGDRSFLLSSPNTLGGVRVQLGDVHSRFHY